MTDEAIDLEELEGYAKKLPGVTAIDNRELADLLRRARRLEKVTAFLREHGAFTVHAVRTAETGAYECGATEKAVEFGRTREALAALMKEMNDVPR